MFHCPRSAYGSRNLSSSTSKAVRLGRPLSFFRVRRCKITGESEHLVPFVNPRKLRAFYLVLILLLATVPSYAQKKASPARSPKGSGADLAIQRGLEFAQKQQFAEAEAAFRQAISLAPRRALAHDYLGSMLAVQNKYDAAIPEFSRAIELDPKLA